jgi:hypothetical protein
MKHKLLGKVAVAATLALTACSPVMQTRETQTRMDSKEFAVYVKSNTTTMTYASAADMEKLIVSVCDALDTGVPFRKLADVVVAEFKGSEEQRDAGFLVGAGIRNTCPQHASKMHS